MAGSLWDMFNWYNWYWFPSDESGNDDSEKESVPEKEKPVIKRKKPVTRAKKQSVPKDGIHLLLLPSILEELEKEAEVADTTLNHLIENILKSHIKSKEHLFELESWKCTYCNPEIEFFDYFEYSNHFFKEHMQPNLQKLSEVNSSL